MDWPSFARWGAKIAQWGADYHGGLRDLPVRAPLNPGATLHALPANPPEQGEAMDAIFADFQAQIMPGMTHWQHPRFFAYFPANATPPSMLAEFLTSTIAAQCMLWQTSPAATELETLMMRWLAQAVGLAGFEGVIQDSASSATLAAVLVMRERALAWQGNSAGLAGAPRLRVYASEEVHTSVDRAIWIAGIGGDNLVRIPTQGPRRGMDGQALRAAIQADRAAGYLPIGVIACIGGTGTGACDDLTAVMAVAQDEGLYSHVDAAWAGAAMICPEFRPLWDGINRADSLVFNPHKWLGVQFDCAAHYLKNPGDLVQTLAIRPEYLKTQGADGVVNYSEWSIPLGRRFRALKLWFVLRAYGLEGLRARIRNHVAWSQNLAQRLLADGRFQIVTQPVLSLFTFRIKGMDDDAQLSFVQRLNDDGRIYVTQTKVAGASVVRLQVGQFDATAADVDMAFDVICEMAGKI